MAHCCQFGVSSPDGCIGERFCLTLQAFLNHPTVGQVPNPDPAVVVDHGPAKLVLVVLALAPDFSVKQGRLLLVAALLSLLDLRLQGSVPPGAQHFTRRSGHRFDLARVQADR